MGKWFHYLIIIKILCIHDNKMNIIHKATKIQNRLFFYFSQNSSECIFTGLSILNTACLCYFKLYLLDFLPFSLTLLHFLFVSLIPASHYGRVNVWLWNKQVTAGVREMIFEDLERDFPLITERGQNVRVGFNHWELKYVVFC